MLTQSKMARELHLSRSVVNDNVQAGMPLDSVEAARQWRRRNVAEKFNRKENAATLAERASKAEVDRELTEEEFGILLESEFRRYLAERPKRKKGRTMSVTFCPSLMIAVWACWGLMDYGENYDPHEVALMVNDLLSIVRDGNGDYLFNGLSDNPDAKLSKGFHDLVLAVTAEN